MIYTVTLNTAVDYYMTIDRLSIGELNRAAYSKVSFGGKGVNVSLRLKEMGIGSVATGFIGGFTGDALESYISSRGIETRLIRVQGGATRINVKIAEQEETELNGVGYTVSVGEYDELLSVLNEAEEGDIAVLSGSVPSGLKGSVYADICAELTSKGARAAVDTSGEALLKTLEYNPLIIKPNIEELSEMFGVKIDSVADVEKYANRLKAMGAENVLVSMGARGAALLDCDGFYYTGAAKGEVVSTVGCGDCMLAAYLAYMDSMSGKELLKKCVEISGNYAFTKR